MRGVRNAMVAFSALTFMIVGMFVLSPAAHAAFEPIEEACKLDPSAAVCADRGTTENPATSTLQNVVNIVAIIGAVIAVIVIIIAGFQFVLSNGDSNKVTNARNMIIYAAVGLVVIALAQQIIALIIRNT